MYRAQEQEITIFSSFFAYSWALSSFVYFCQAIGFIVVIQGGSLDINFTEKNISQPEREPEPLKNVVKQIISRGPENFKISLQQ